MRYITVVIVFFALVFDKLNIFASLIVCTLLHETGHVIACILLNTKPKILFSLFGVKLCNYPKNKLSKFIVLIAGPLMNLIITVISFCCVQFDFSLKIYIFMCVNIVVLLFNMLPIHFLDGGQIILLFFDNSRVRNIMDVCGFVVLYVTVIIFSDNLISTTAALIVFFAYYILNKNNLHRF